MMGAPSVMQRAGPWAGLPRHEKPKEKKSAPARAPARPAPAAADGDPSERKIPGYIPMVFTIDPTVFHNDHEHRQDAVDKAIASEREYLARIQKSASEPGGKCPFAAGDPFAQDVRWDRRPKDLTTSMYRDEHFPRSMAKVAQSGTQWPTLALVYIQSSY